MSMTENEAKVLLCQMYLPQFDEKEKQALTMAIEALEEIQQYREMGKKLNGISVEQVVDGFIRTVTNQTNEDYKNGRILTNEEAAMWDECRAIGTVEEFKALKEKSVAKKVNIERWIYTKCSCGYVFSKHHGDGYYSVPYENRTKHCPNCGQKLYWE